MPCVCHGTADRAAIIIGAGQTAALRFGETVGLFGGDPPQEILVFRLDRVGGPGTAVSPVERDGVADQLQAEDTGQAELPATQVGGDAPLPRRGGGLLDAFYNARPAGGEA